MRKEYIEPQVEAIEMLPEGMLCLSGDIDGDATEPALSPFFDEDEVELFVE